MAADELDTKLTISLDDIIKQDGEGRGRGRGRGKGTGKGKGKASGTGGKGRGKKTAAAESSKEVATGQDKEKNDHLDMSLEDVISAEEKSSKKGGKDKGKGRANSKGKDNSDSKGSSKGKGSWSEWSSWSSGGDDGSGDRKGKNSSKGGGYNSSWSDKGSKGRGKSGSASSWGGSGGGKGKGGGGSSGGTPIWNEHDDWRHGDDDDDDSGYGGKGKGRRGSDWDDWDSGQDRWSNGRSGGSGGSKWGSWESGSKGGKGGKDDDGWGRGGDSWGGGSGSWDSRDEWRSERPTGGAWAERSRRPDPPEAPPRGTWNRAVGATRDNEREDRGGASSRNGYASRRAMDDRPSSRGPESRSDRGWSGAPQKRKHPGDDLDECKNVKVTNIPRDLEMQDIKDAFEMETGRITRCKLDRGTAWIAFSNSKSAQKAVDTFDHGELNGQTIGVALDP